MDCPLSTNTFHTFVTMMLTVPTPKDLITVHVCWDTQRMEEIAEVRHTLPFLHETALCRAIFR